MRTQVRNFPKTPEEGWRVYQPKRCVNNKHDEDNYPSIAKMKAPASIVFIVYLFYQVSRVSGVCPEGQLEHGDKCCKPVTHCPSGSYVKTCERNGSCDKCLPCPSGTGNLFITSSFDVKRCHKDNCPTGSFRTSEDKCECAFHDGYIETEDKMFCQKIDRVCQPGLELNFRGRCETCADDHYKYWNGHGYCVKQMDCSKIRLSKIPGNHTIPATCLGFNDTCSQERFPPLPPGWKPRGSPIPFVQGTTRRPILWAKITTKPRLLQTTHIINPKKTSQETTSNETYEGAAYSPGTVHACIAVICVLFIITVILFAYIVRIKLQSRKKRKLNNNNNNNNNSYKKIGQGSSASGRESDQKSGIELNELLSTQ
ncbi:uncharacterized protein LOC115224785 isoform X2 [Octopus sinensis]|uniref:Uncharacterized protein LOC115224785 isoform X2 n=1 Tax=Octopus sinensis TaxID=2607531 RepID=A0A6P7TNP1_9MOLL|nr:uncharacterized protein LOC115224785 isoform X2 [Octopus sinensis]